MTNERRNFIKNLAIISIGLSINPSLLFAKAGIKIDKGVLKILEETSIEVNPTIRQLNNYCISSELSETELKKEYVSLVNMLALSSSANYGSLSNAKKYKELKKAQTKQDISQKQVKELYQAAILTGSVALGTMYITRGKITILLAATGAILSVPKWMISAGRIIDGATTMYQGGTMIRDAVTNSTIYSAEVGKKSIYDKFINTNSDQFRLELSKINVDFSSNSLSINNALKTNHLSDPVAAELINWIKEEVVSKNIFTSEADLKVFMDNYIVKIGEIQETSLKKMFSAEQEKNKQKALEVRDTAALCQSIHGAIGLAISNLAAPKEAELLNTLIGAGFQYAIAGMSPIGWTAVGINIATTLFSKSPNNTFQDAVLKALQQIQKQLNYIIEQVEVLQKNQVEILIQLNEILKRIDNVEDIITSEFRNLNEKVDLIYDTLKVSGKEEIINEYGKTKDDLIDSYNNKDWDSFYKSIQSLRHIAKDRLDDPILTQYNNGNLRAESLKKQVLFDSRYKLNISLYDSIGLSSAFYNYSNGSGATDFKPIHPIEFSIISETIIGWLVVSELSKQKKKETVKHILEIAEYNDVNFRRIASQEVIKNKSNEYRRESEALIYSLYKFMLENEEKKTLAQPNLFGKFILTTLPNLKDYQDETMSDINISSNFLVNHNDNKLYNLAQDMKLFIEIRSLEVQSPNLVRKTNNDRFREIPMNVNNHFPGFNLNDTIGRKQNRIIFNNVLVDYSKSVFISFELDYTGWLYITDVADTLSDHQGCGHDGNYDCYKIRRAVRSTRANFEVNPSWKDKVVSQCKEKGLDIIKVIPDFDNTSFDQFLQHLIIQAFWLLKDDLIKQSVNHINKPQFTHFDGIGLSMMVLSKLNNLITSNTPEPYVFDYYDELYLREDIISTLEAILKTDLKKQNKELFNRIQSESLKDSSDNKENSNFYLMDGTGFTNKLKPENFVDFCMIVLKEKVKDTIMKSIDKTSVVETTHSEPFIKNAITRLNWYLNTQI